MFLASIGCFPEQFIIVFLLFILLMLVILNWLMCGDIHCMGSCLFGFWLCRLGSISNFGFRFPYLSCRLNYFSNCLEFIHWWLGSGGLLSGLWGCGFWLCNSSSSWGFSFPFLLKHEGLFSMFNREHILSMKISLQFLDLSVCFLFFVSLPSFLPFNLL